MRSVMNILLSRSSSRLLVIALCVICSGGIIFSASRVWLAAELANTRNPSDWARAVKIEPGNAAYWNQLGKYEEWDLTYGNAHQAVRDFERATRLDPHAALLWTALASSYEATAQPGKARQAYIKAQAAYPVSAEVAWQYGNFLIGQGETREAAAQVRRALLEKPELVPGAVSQFSKAGVDLNQILEQVLPARREDYLAALNYFLSQNENDAALATWGKLAGLGQKLPLNASMDLIDNLIAVRRAHDAELVWRQALASAGRASQLNTSGSLIFNGNFEHNLVNGGFGWRWIPTRGALLDLVGDITHSSTQSARVTFDGTANPDFSGLRQYVPVSPGVRYHFSAYIRTDAISTDSGPQFVIRTCHDPLQQLAQTPMMIGTHPWTEVRTDFTTGANTDCINVVLRRAPSRIFVNRMSGTVWVDNVRLFPAAAGGKSVR